MYKVSFCIPVYNNSDVAEKIAQTMLMSSSNCFQLVFSDSGSNDDTRSRLECIDDDRVKVVGFDHHVDGRRNWLNALENGDGDWRYLVMGRDRLDTEKMVRLLDFLRTAEEQGIILAKDKQVSQLEEGECFHLGKLQSYDALLMNDHPTGLIVRGYTLETSAQKKEFFNTDYMYPENYLIQELVQNSGKSMMFCSGVNTGEVFIDKTQVLSKMVKIGDENELFWYPPKLTDHTIRLIEMVENDKELTANNLGAVFLQKLELLYICIQNWAFYLTDGTAFAKHYGVDQRTVAPAEVAEKMTTGFQSVLERFQDRDWCTPTIIETSKIMTKKYILSCFV